MLLPTLAETESLLDDAAQRNPGVWVEHTRNVGRAACAIAAQTSDLDSDNAYILGALHDIGRRCGVCDLRHVIHGYHYLMELGYPDAARISLTHSFPYPTLDAYLGNFDCSADEILFLRSFLSNIKTTRYDRLIQLCDALAMSTGFCVVEQRMVDVAMRYGTNEYMLIKWKAIFELKNEFDRSAGCSIYTLLPGIETHVFGYNQPD